MGKKKRKRFSPYEVAIFGIGIVFVFVVGGIVYALITVSINTLRWWAGLATLALPITAGIFFYLGRVEARGQIAGLEQGVSTVMNAAQKTADLRAAQVREARRPVDPPRPANAPDIVIVPSSPHALPGGQSGDVLEI